MTTTTVCPSVRVRLYEAQSAETAAALAQILQIHYGMGAMDAAHAVSQLETLDLIEIDNSVEDGPITITERGYRVLFL